MKRDLTATREAQFKNIWARDAGIFTFLSGIREIFTTKIYVLLGNSVQPGEQSVMFSSKLKIDLVNIYPVETVQLSPDEQRRSPAVSTGCQESALVHSHTS